MYRKFQLENSKGQTWDLTDQLVKSFLNNPSGLGFQQTIGTIQYGNKLNVISSNTNFPSVSGDLLFYDDANTDKYDLYFDFVEFCTHAPLILSYEKPGSEDIYYLDCEVSNLGKTEVKTDHLLTCPITFQGLSMWYGDEIEINGSALSYTIGNVSHFPVGFEIKIEGSIENPYIQLEQDEELYGEAKFDDSVAFNKVYVNSKDGEQNVILEQGGSVLPNPLSYQDLSISNGSIYVTFVKLARGTSTLTIGMDSGSVTSVNIKYSPQYRSV